MFSAIINNQAYAAWVLNFLTLILIIIAYRQLKNLSNQVEKSRFQEGVIKHITDLKEFFYGWKSSLPLVPSTEELPFDESLIREMAINQIERNPLFEDVKTHLPKGYETLLDKWKKYKQLLLNEYFNEYNNVIDRIKNEIQEKELIPESIYTRAVNLLKKGQRWNYHKGKVSENQYVLNYGISYGSSVVEKGFILIEKGTDEEVREREEEHKIFSDKIKSKYEVELKKLIEKEKELNEQRKSLFENLENLRIYPDFPKTGSCDIIKSIYKKLF